MKNDIFSLLLVASIGMVCNGPIHARADGLGMGWDDVAILVDGLPIYWEQIQREINRASRQAAANQRNVSTERMKNIAIDLVLTRMLVESAMNYSGTVVAHEEIEAAKELLVNGMNGGGSMQKLEMLLVQDGMTMAELEHNLRLDIFKNRQIAPRLDAALAELTDEKLHEIYEYHIQSFVRPAGRMVSHILLHMPPQADYNQRVTTYARAEEIRQRLLNGADFAETARRESDCVSRQKGGHVGLIIRGKESPAVDAAVFTQEIGAIGEVVESPIGLHILLIHEDVEEGFLPFEEVKDNICEQVKRQIQDQLTKEYYESLRERANIRFMESLE